MPGGSWGKGAGLPSFISSDISRAINMARPEIVIRTADRITKKILTKLEGKVSLEVVEIIQGELASFKKEIMEPTGGKESEVVNW